MLFGYLLSCAGLGLLIGAEIGQRLRMGASHRTLRFHGRWRLNASAAFVLMTAGDAVRLSGLWGQVSSAEIVIRIFFMLVLALSAILLFVRPGDRPDLMKS